MAQVGTITALYRYPVKSMLGQDQTNVQVTQRGLAGDRVYALIDVQSGKVVSAKLPHRWRRMLQMQAARHEHAGKDRVEITLPGGKVLDCADPTVDAALSTVLGRSVTLVSIRPDDLEMERAHPEAVIEKGESSEVSHDVLPVGIAAPDGGFFDYAPIHFITTTSLAAVAGATANGEAEPVRYRPNLIIGTPAGTAFQENGWVGSRLAIGADLILEVVAPTPRCAVPTLAHGNLPVDVQALQRVAALNKIPVFDLGRLACLGAYAKVVQPGSIDLADPVRLITG